MRLMYEYVLGVCVGDNALTSTFLSAVLLRRESSAENRLT